MSEQHLLPPPEPATEAPPAPPSSPRRDLVPWLYGLGFLVLAVAVLYLWQYPSTQDGNATDASALQTVEQHLAEIDARLNRLEQRPTPDIGKIGARLDALEGRVADQTQLASRLDTLSGRFESLSNRDQTSIDTTKQQLSALTGRVTALESSNGNIEAVNGRLGRIAKLQEAFFALGVGRPLGDLPNAPQALARYSHTAPPTEADLRLRFPKAEQAALAAHQPDNENAPLMDRVWERAQGLVTVRRGENVVVGNPAAVVLGRAQKALDAGDLAAAVNAVETLTGEPQQAMAPWLTDAKALLEARSALAHMADQA